MLRSPKVYRADLKVAEARSAFADGHVHMLLITDGDKLLGTVCREDLTSFEGAAKPQTVMAGRITAPTVSAEDARQSMIANGIRRLAVVDEEHELLGLLCLKRKLNGFCSDADIQARLGSSLNSAGLRYRNLM